MASIAPARSITLKLKVAYVTESNDAVQVSCYADYMDARNKDWAPFTPAAQLQITVKPDLAADFPVGRNFLVTLAPEDE